VYLLIDEKERSAEWRRVRKTNVREKALVARESRPPDRSGEVFPGKGMMSRVCGWGRRGHSHLTLNGVPKAEEGGKAATFGQNRKCNEKILAGRGMQ